MEENSTEENNSQHKDNQKTISFSSITTGIKPILIPIAKFFDLILPPYEPKINLEEKLVSGEMEVEHAIIRHFSELQLLSGIFSIILGFVLQIVYNTGYLLLFTIMGILLVLSAYDMEEIYVTSHRIMVRRVGMIERILKVPSDEEHALEHLVSFNVGRAPANYILLALSLPGYLVLFDDAMADFPQLLVIFASSVIFVFGLRINRRAVTLHLAGGLNIVLGIRKGIPKRIITALQKSMYEDKPSKVSQERINDEKPAKELDDQ